MPDVAHIALGSNLGHREGNIAEAALRIDNLPETRVDVLSSLYETAPVGKTDQPRFVNAVLQAETGLSPRELLRMLLGVEREMGRERLEPWGPRLIDLDLLLLGDHVIESEEITLPHPLMGKRHFVLFPLVEIAPGVRDPVSGRAWSDVMETLPDVDWGRRMEVDDE
jgi:2-amino-4-hydroxy-6-hydroxymethyldihydropteridine diphosphokinase